MIYKKIANKHYEELGCATTVSTSKHGPGPRIAKAKRYLNRQAKRAEAKLAFNDNAQ